MATIKTTKKDNFNAILAILATVDVANKAELTEFITHEIDLLDKKSANARPSRARRRLRMTVSRPLLLRLSRPLMSL